MHLRAGRLSHYVESHRIQLSLALHIEIQLLDHLDYQLEGPLLQLRELIMLTKSLKLSNRTKHEGEKQFADKIIFKKGSSDSQNLLAVLLAPYLDQVIDLLEGIDHQSGEAEEKVRAIKTK